MISLAGKKAIITGGASGIGKATSLLFAELGADVAIFDVNELGMAEVASTIRHLGRTSLPLKTDVTVYDEVKNSTRQVAEAFGRIDILANVAGWDLIQPFLENEVELWQKIVNINLWGVIFCSRAVLEYMINQSESGTIVNVASDAGRVGSSGEAVYSACKGGVVAFTKTIAREMARHGIRVNCVCPGQVDSPLLDSVRSLKPAYVEAVIKACPMRRPGKPEEVANAIAFLASEQASFITGQTLSISGGLTMV